jgi:hypothetical protein
VNPYQFSWATGGAITTSAYCPEQYITMPYTVGASCLQSVITSSSVTSNVVWVNWNQSFVVSADSGVTTFAEHQVEVQRLQEARMQERLDRELKKLKAKEEADQRAEALLKCFLSSSQRAQYEAERAFEVITCRSGVTRTYRLRKGWAGNVFLLDDKGRQVEKYCIHPDVAVPEADNLVAQKLLLESNEEEFLRVANRTPIVYLPAA